MNDQMYKHNKKVMSSEYGDNIGRPKQKTSRKERFNSDLSRTSTVTSDQSLYDENIVKTITKRIFHFIFSQVSLT